MIAAMQHLLCLALLLAIALPAAAVQTRWIYRNPSTSSGVGTLVDDSDPTRSLRDVRLAASGATTINLFGNGGTANLGDLDLSLPIESEDGATTYTIGAFGSSCFYGNGSLRSIRLPTYLEAIPAECFRNCTALTNAPLPAGLTAIGSQAFSGCSSLASDIVLPDGVAEVNNVWRGTKIKSFAAGAGLQKIHNQAFYEVRSLTNVNFSAATSLTYIGSEAFRNDTGLVSISALPASLETLGSQAFFGCSALVGDIVIPDGVTTINNVFRGTKIGSIAFGAGLRTLESQAFYEMKSLTNVSFSACASLETIGSQCFHNNTSMACDLSTLPRTLTKLGSQAFWNCPLAAGDVVLPDGIAEISNVFRYTGITSFTAGAGLLTIGNDCFRSCSAITNLDLSPATSLRTIGSSAFQDLSAMACNLSGAGLPRSLTSLGAQAFWCCRAATGDVVLPDAIASVNNTFRGTAITSFTAGAGLETIANDSFRGMASLVAIDLAPATNLVSIGSGAFQDDSNIACDLVLPSTLTNLGTQAFWYCSKMTGTVVLPDAITTLNGTFRGCPLDFFHAGAGLATIANEAFRGSPLRGLDLSAAKNLSYIGDRAFQDCTSITNDLRLPRRGMETIRPLAFFNCSKMGGDLVLPETVTNLPGQVFAYSRISSIAAKGVRSIGDQCFRSAPALARIELGWNLGELLGHEALNGASAVKAVYWRSPPDPALCTGNPPMGGWDWRAAGCTNYVPWDVRAKAAISSWQDFAAAYNSEYGTLELPAKRDGVGTLRHSGRNEVEYVAYWLPDLNPATTLLIR